jgi:hypothetical protein
MELSENGSFRLFAADGKRKFVFLGQQTINGNQRLLFQQTCPSMVKGQLGKGQIMKGQMVSTPTNSPMRICPRGLFSKLPIFKTY